MIIRDMQPNMITLRIKDKLFGLCWTGSRDEKEIDVMLSKVKFRLLEGSTS